MNNHKPDTEPRQIPLRAAGLHVHDCISDDLVARIRNYPLLRHDATPSEVAAWANNHPACNTRVDRKLLSAIPNFIIQKGYGQLSHDALAAKCNCTRRTVINRLNRFRGLGIIHCDTQYADGGRGGKVKRPNHYGIEFDYGP